MLKGLAPQFAFLLRRRTTRRNLGVLFKLLLAFSVIVTVFSVLFHLIMLSEGQEFSWFTVFIGRLPLCQHWVLAILPSMEIWGVYSLWWFC